MPFVALIATPLIYNSLAAKVPATTAVVDDTTFASAVAWTPDLLDTLLIAATLAMAPDWPLKLLIALVSFPLPT